MNILRSSGVTALLLASTVSIANAQEAMGDKLKDKATNMAVDKAKTEVKSQVKDAVNSPVADKAIDMGADMAKGTSVKDVAQDAVMDGATSKAKGMATDRMPGGGTIKNRAPEVSVPAAIVNDGGVIVHNDGSTSSATSGAIVMQAPQPVPVSSPVSAPAPNQSGVPTNCPAGTTGQADGTCMITGSWGR